MVDKWLTVETMGLILELFWEELMNSIYDVLLGTAEHPVVSAKRGQRIMMMMMMRPFYEFFWLGGDGLPEDLLKGNPAYVASTRPRRYLN